MSDNRIVNAIEAVRPRLRVLPEDKIQAMDEAATLNLDSWAALGHRPALGLAEGRLSMAEANILHDIHTRFRSDATLAERMVFMLTMQELMS